MEKSDQPNLLAQLLENTCSDVFSLGPATNLADQLWIVVGN
jgi:hypothetical protein